MIELTYIRAGVIDLRRFKTPEELVDWLIRQSSIEAIEITNVKKINK